MQSFIWNNEPDILAEVLRAAFQRATHIEVAIAFLKASGLNRLKPEIRLAVSRNCSIRFVIGTDFYSTEPDALHWLLREFEKSSTCELYVVGQQGDSTFHPKVYLIQSVDSILAVIGSSNLTGGGLSNNWEGNLLFPLQDDDPVYHGIRSMLDVLINSGAAQPADRLTIADYARRYEIYHRHVQPAVKKANRDAESEAKQMVKLDKAKLQTLLSEYLASAPEVENYQLRVRNYRIARQLLDQIASDETDSRSNFADKFSRLIAGSGQEGAWHSGSLFRHKGELIAQWKAIQAIVRYIKEHPSAARGELFGQVREMAKKVGGLGVNVPTEIMHTYYPGKCAVLNQNSYKSLLELAIGSKYPGPLSFHAEDYDNFVSYLIYLKELCGLGSLGQADHFLNYVYWKVVKVKSI